MVIVCNHAKQTCLFFPGGKRLIQRGFEDPAAFRGGKDDPKGRVQEVLLYIAGVA